MSQSNQQFNMVNPSCETCGGPHYYFEFQVACGFTQWDVYAATRNNNMGVNQMKKIENSFNERPQGALPSNSIPNPREDIKAITTWSGITLAKPSVPPPNPPSTSKEVERDPELTMNQMHISMVLLKKLPGKLRDPGKFLIPCDFRELEECLDLADLELANQSVAFMAGIAEDVFVQVGMFTFFADFVVVNYDVYPRVPLILWRPFLSMARALVDVYEEELILESVMKN
nr:DNA-directed DNA polymerase [Tanacetum cinerariifolium]